MSDSLARRLSIGEGSDHIDVEEAWLPYTLLRILGRGGCSVVEEVEDQTTGSVYARKVFFTTRRNKNHLKQIFENEVNVIRSLGQGHHHMVRVFATYTTRNSLALILSPVANGGDLERYLDALPTNGSDEQLRSEMTAILSQAFGCLAAGLDFLKQNNIRHKDIKTSNILIHNSQVYYTDFGLSFKSGTLENSTTYGLPDGMTPRFAAPEVLQGNPRNSSSDVYSLGCVYVDIFTALSESHLPHGVVYDMDLRFSATMEVIHQQLRLSQSFVSEIVPKLIISMTQTIPGNRCTASEVLESCMEEVSLCCRRCRQFKHFVNGYDSDGYNVEGYSREGYDREGFDVTGYSRDGYGRDGYGRDGYGRDGYDRASRDRDGYNRHGYKWDGFDRDGYNRAGRDRDGYDRHGYKSDGYNKYGYNRQGFDRDGYGKDGYGRDGCDKDGYDRDGYKSDGYNKLGYDRHGFDRSAYDRDGYRSDGYNSAGYSRHGFDRNGYDMNGYDMNGFPADNFMRHKYHKYRPYAW